MSAWSWPIMVTVDPDPEYAEVMEGLVVLLVPDRDEKGDRLEEPRVLAWKELFFDEVLDWVLENAIVPCDLDSAIEQLKAKQRELKRELKP